MTHAAGPVEWGAVELLREQWIDICVFLCRESESDADIDLLRVIDDALVREAGKGAVAVSFAARDVVTLSRVVAGDAVDTASVGEVSAIEAFVDAVAEQLHVRGHDVFKRRTRAAVQAERARAEYGVVRCDACDALWPVAEAIRMGLRFATLCPYCGGPSL